MRTVLVVGIGAGDPDYVTIQAIKALNRADVLFVVEKGAEKDELVRLRTTICDRFIEKSDEEPAYRLVEIADPERDRSAPAYRAAVAAWRRERADRYEAALRDELSEDGVGAFLVWGDPSLYDSTVAILDEIVARGRLELTYEVIPGISSAQALAARQKVTLNRVGEPIVFTTGRRLAEMPPGEVRNVVVMLDAGNAFAELDGDDLEIYWGAYVGMEDELLVSGSLLEVKDEIARLRAEARARNGWIMDTYLLRRREP
jgi:precorrin-6A synthase